MAPPPPPLVLAQNPRAQHISTPSPTPGTGSPRIYTPNNHATGRPTATSGTATTNSEPPNMHTTKTVTARARTRDDDSSTDDDKTRRKPSGLSTTTSNQPRYDAPTPSSLSRTTSAAYRTPTAPAAQPVLSAPVPKHVPLPPVSVPSSAAARMGSATTSPTATISRGLRAGTDLASSAATTPALGTKAVPIPIQTQQARAAYDGNGSWGTPGSHGSGSDRDRSLGKAGGPAAPHLHRPPILEEWRQGSGSSSGEGLTGSPASGQMHKRWRPSTDASHSPPSTPLQPTPTSSRNIISLDSPLQPNSASSGTGTFPASASAYASAISSSPNASSSSTSSGMLHHKSSTTRLATVPELDRIHSSSSHPHHHSLGHAHGREMKVNGRREQIWTPDPNTLESDAEPVPSRAQREKEQREKADRELAERILAEEIAHAHAHAQAREVSKRSSTQSFGSVRRKTSDGVLAGSPVVATRNAASIMGNPMLASPSPIPSRGMTMPSVLGSAVLYSVPSSATTYTHASGALTPPDPPSGPGTPDLFPMVASELPKLGMRAGPELDFGILAAPAPAPPSVPTVNSHSRTRSTSQEITSALPPRPRSPQQVAAPLPIPVTPIRAINAQSAAARARARPPGTRTPNATMSQVDDDADEWVKVLRNEHILRFERNKQSLLSELKERMMQIAKQEADALTASTDAPCEDFAEMRKRAKEDYEQQLATYQALQDGQLAQAIAERSTSPSNASRPDGIPQDIWEESFRAEQQIIMAQVEETKRRASVNADPPTTSRSRQISGASTTRAIAPGIDGESTREDIRTKMDVDEARRRLDRSREEQQQREIDARLKREREDRQRREFEDRAARKASEQAQLGEEARVRREDERALRLEQEQRRREYEEVLLRKHREQKRQEEEVRMLHTMQLQMEDEDDSMHRPGLVRRSSMPRRHATMPASPAGFYGSLRSNSIPIPGRSRQPIYTAEPDGEADSSGDDDSSAAPDGDAGAEATDTEEDDIPEQRANYEHPPHAPHLSRQPARRATLGPAHPAYANVRSSPAQNPFLNSHDSERLGSTKPLPPVHLPATRLDISGTPPTLSNSSMRGRPVSSVPTSSRPSRAPSATPSDISDNDAHRHTIERGQQRYAMTMPPAGSTSSAPSRTNSSSTATTGANTSATSTAPTSAQSSFHSIHPHNEAHVAPEATEARVAAELAQQQREQEEREASAREALRIAAEEEENERIRHEAEMDLQQQRQLAIQAAEEKTRVREREKKEAEDRERLRAAAAERKRKEEEAERKRKEEEAAEQKRKEEEAERKFKLAQELERKRKLEEEVERRRKEQEAVECKRREEEAAAAAAERQRLLREQQEAEELERKRLAEERKKKKEETARKRREEEERRQREAELERVRKEEERQRIEEENRQRQLAEEQDRQRQLELAAERQRLAAEREQERLRLLEAERQRQLEAERQLQLEAERQRQVEAERERQRQIEERERQLKVELERQRQLELEREQEYQRQLEAERECERQAQAELERQRQAAVERERERQHLEAERQRKEAGEQRERARREKEERERQRKEKEEEHTRTEHDRRIAEALQREEEAQFRREQEARQRHAGSERAKRDGDRRTQEEYQRRADEAQRRFQERKRAEDEDKARARTRTGNTSNFTGSGTSYLPGQTPPFSSTNPGLNMHTGSAPRAPSGSATAAVFETYDKAWSDLPDKAAKGPLRWRDIPWPMVVKPRHTEELDNKLIANFVLSPLHSPGKEGKDRLRSQLLRWHPDRFESKWLSKCAEDERAEIQRGVGFVVRCLNELMSAQNSVAAGAL